VTAPILLVLLAGAAGIVLAALFYLREDLRGGRRALLMSARVLVLAIVLLLLLDVSVPGTDPTVTGERADSWVLVDSDLSLLVPDPATGSSLWEEVGTRAAMEVARGSRLALATPGDRGPEGLDTLSLALREPSHPPGDIFASLDRLAEVGADSVILFSSLREPLGFLARLQAEAPVSVRLMRVGDIVRNAGVARLDLPDRTAPDEAVQGSLTIFGEGGRGPESVIEDSVRATILADGEPVSELGLRLPDPGAPVTVPLELPAPGEGRTMVRYTVRLEVEGDVFPLDDERSRWVEVGDPEAGILLVSDLPDWEPRYLLPVIEAVTGIEGEGYLRVGEGRYITLSEGSEPTRLVEIDEVLGRFSRADLVVLHGIGSGSDSRLLDEASGHPGLVVLPSDADGARALGLTATEGIEGEWSLQSETPASPLFPFLSGLQLSGLPPLTRLIPTDPSEEWTVALSTEGGPAADPFPVILLGDVPEGRRGVMLGEGLWRWGSRGGAPRDAYRALWGGISDWILAGRPVVGGGGVEPVARVVPRGEPVLWRVAPEAVGAELLLASVTPEPGMSWENPEDVEGETVTRMTLGPGDGETFATPPMEPGMYRYRVESPEGAATPLPPVAGWIEVEEWVPSLQHPPLEVDEGWIRVADGLAAASIAPGRPLRSHLLPYVLLVLLLCVEWIGRRAWGLR
jgi:hypothetical protein